MATRQFTFGPGSLEDLTLSLWHRKQSNTIEAKLVGTYRIYCGNGGDHVEYVEARHSYDAGRTRGRAPGDGGEAADAYHGTGDVGTARRHIAEQLVQWGTEDWSDPCDTADEEVLV